MPHQIVTENEWITARTRLLSREKELTRLRDEIAAERRAMPWVRVDKGYMFEGPSGKESLSDLFAGRSQLVIRHFMFGPDWSEGCVGCSFWADHLDGALPHLEHHDVTVVVVSRARFGQIEAFQRRMGWRFKWVSSFDSDFNYDFGVSFTPEQLSAGHQTYNYQPADRVGEEMPGLSVFHKDVDGQVAHTYSSYARGNEGFLGAYAILDLTPNGRDENGPSYNLTDWVRHHDRYDDLLGASCCQE
jgi:predicted dithiol-disulfide oxidoreductase (DUF899 family)